MRCRSLGIAFAAGVALVALGASCGRDAVEQSPARGAIAPDPGGFERDLRLVLVTSNRATIAAGEHGLRMKTVVANDWSDPLPVPPITLLFHDTAGQPLAFE